MAKRLSCCYVVALGWMLLATSFASAVETTPPAAAEVPLTWHAEYQLAYQQAQTQHKMLLLFFYDDAPSVTRQAVEAKIAADPQVRGFLSKYVLVKLPTSAKIQVGGQERQLIRDASLAEMHAREGIAIIDLAHEGTEYYGHVVSAYPFMSSKYYRFRPEYLSSILTLPAGTITQRTMVWAVRIHPEQPASTRGRTDSTLVAEARSHSHYQAQLGVQGHHRWDMRFQRIRRLLGGGRAAPVEIVAESWPNQTMIDSCIDCVDSWRHSSGHWNAVKSYQASYGYDIKRGGNGIWYGTGIFAN